MWYTLTAFKGYPTQDEKAYLPGDIIPDAEAEAMGLISKPDLAERKEAAIDPQNP